jgi:hypothetical protein
MVGVPTYCPRTEYPGGRAAAPTAIAAAARAPEA